MLVKGEEAEGITRSVKCLHEDPSLRPENPWKQASMVACICNPSLGRQRLGVPWVSLAGQQRLVGEFETSEKAPSQTKQGRYYLGRTPEVNFCPVCVTHSYTHQIFKSTVYS